MFPVLKGRSKGNGMDYSSRAVRYDQLKLSSRVLDRLSFVRLVRNCVNGSRRFVTNQPLAPVLSPMTPAPTPHTLHFLVFILMLTSSCSLRLSFGLAACFGFPTTVLYAFLSSLPGHELFLLLLLLLLIFLLLILLLLLLLSSSSSMTLRSFDFELSLPYDSRPFRLES